MSTRVLRSIQAVVQVIPGWVDDVLLGCLWGLLGLHLLGL
jgi:hypothetical protein